MKDSKRYPVKHGNSINVKTPKEIKERLKEIGWEKPKENRHNFIVVNGYKVSEHRHIWEKHNGKIPKGMFIHHKNENGKDNRIENLQLVTPKEHGKLHRELRRKI